MSEVTIKTDHKWKNFKYGYEVPKSVLEKQFNWLNECGKEDGFILYKKYWYHVSEFMLIDNNENFKGFDGYVSDSFFSGILIKLSIDGEQYQIATYYS